MQRFLFRLTQAGTGREYARLRLTHGILGFAAVEQRLLHANCSVLWKTRIFIVGINAIIALIEAGWLTQGRSSRAAVRRKAGARPHARRRLGHILVAHAHIGALFVEVGIIGVGLGQGVADRLRGRLARRQQPKICKRAGNQQRKCKCVAGGPLARRPDRRRTARRH